MAGKYIRSIPDLATARPMANMSRQRRWPRADAARLGASPHFDDDPIEGFGNVDQFRRGPIDEDRESMMRGLPGKCVDQSPREPAKPPPIRKATPIDSNLHGRPHEEIKEESKYSGYLDRAIHRENRLAHFQRDAGLRIEAIPGSVRVGPATRVKTVRWLFTRQ